MLEKSPVQELELAGTPSEAVLSVECIAEKENDDNALCTIIVQNLRHPGGWIKNRQFQSLLDKSVKYNVAFSRPKDSNEKQIKMGTIEILFSSSEIARNAYTSLQKMIIDGERPEVLVDPLFFSIETSTASRKFFELSNDPRLVFLLDAPKSIDEHMIAYFFSGENPIHFQTLPMPSQNGLFQVEVLISSGEVAEKILAGSSKFSISDGDVECTVIVLSPREYELYSKMDDVRPSENNVHKATVQISQVENSGHLAPEIDEEAIQNRILEIIEERKLNFAEINEKDELYELCDTVSAEYNGVPDSILKPAMGSVLQKHLNRTEMHWMREHIEGLLKMWKTEILNEQMFERPTFVPMETVNYKPVNEEQSDAQSKGAAKRKRAARQQMGVAAFLSANRVRLIVESGDVDIDSDEDGNYMIGGDEPLSFNSWARITKTKGSGVVRANDDGSKKIGNNGFTKKQMRQARAVEGMSQEEWKKWRNEKSSTRKAEIKKRIMERGAVMYEEEAVEEGTSDAPTSSEAMTVLSLPSAKKDLDEGEIDSEEERKEQSSKKKRKALPSDSSDSSTSSSDEDPSSPVDARKRRKIKRKLDRKYLRSSMANTGLDPTFRQMFENRKAIIAQMTPAHKSAFASALNYVVQNNPAGVPQAKTTQVINSMMSAYRKF